MRSTTRTATETTRMNGVHKSAQKIGTIEFAHGDRNELYVSRNRNSHELIVWQCVPGRRARRVTGRNITAMLAAIDECMFEGTGRWVELDDAALDATLAETGYAPLDRA